MTTEVSCSLVLDQQRAQPLQQAVGGAVLRDGPHRVVAGHQEEVGLGAGHALLQPQQLSVGVGTVGPAGLLVQEVVSLPTQQDRVHHEDGHRAVRVGDPEVQLVVVVWVLPEVGGTVRANEASLSTHFKTIYYGIWKSETR